MEGSKPKEAPVPHDEYDRVSAAFSRIKALEKELENTRYFLMFVGGATGWLLWSWVEKFGW